MQNHSRHRQLQTVKLAKNVFRISLIVFSHCFSNFEVFNIQQFLSEVFVSYVALLEINSYINIKGDNLFIYIINMNKLIKIKFC